MTKPISTRVHGLIDYGWVAAATALSRRVDGATSTARLLRYAATTTTASSLVTNYEAGAVRMPHCVRRSSRRRSSCLRANVVTRSSRFCWV
jgi:hypothetical protein